MRRLISAASGAVRDYLLDPNLDLEPKHRDQARQDWAQAIRDIGDYKRVAPSERKPLMTIASQRPDSMSTPQCADQG